MLALYYVTETGTTFRNGKKRYEIKKNVDRIYTIMATFNTNTHTHTRRMLKF